MLPSLAGVRRALLRGDQRSTQPPVEVSQRSSSAQAASFTQPQVPRLGRHSLPGPQAVEAVHAQVPPLQVLPSEHVAAEVQVEAWQVCVVASQRCAPQNPTVASQRGKQKPSPVGVWRQK